MNERSGSASPTNTIMCVADTLVHCVDFMLCCGTWLLSLLAHAISFTRHSENLTSDPNLNLVMSSVQTSFLGRVAGLPISDAARSSFRVELLLVYIERSQQRCFGHWTSPG